MFYDIHQNSVNDTKFFWKKLDCLDEPLEIQGDYNSYKGKIFKIVFEKCVNFTFEGIICKPEHEIQQFLRRKFITTLHN